MISSTNASNSYFNSSRNIGINLGRNSGSTSLAQILSAQAGINQSSSTQVAANRSNKDLTKFQSLSIVATNSTTAIDSTVKRLSELAKKANNDTVSDTERAQLDNQFQKLKGQLERLASRSSFEGKKLFDGNFSADAGKHLKPLIFTGAENQPTPEQATLKFPALKLEEQQYLSIDTKMNAIVALNDLNKLAANVKTAMQENSDFSATLKFANNTLQGAPNKGPSITQTNVAKQATDIAAVAKTNVQAIETALLKLKSVATKAADPTKTDIDRAFLQQSVDLLQSEIDRVVSTSKRDGAPLDGSLEYSLSPALDKYLFTGARNQPTRDAAQFKLGALDSSSLLGDPGIELSTQESAYSALSKINDALAKITQAKNEVSDFGNAINFAKAHMSASENKKAVNLTV